MEGGTQEPIVFILGPSGSGKTTLGRWASEDLGFLHLEIDQWPIADGIDATGLRSEWDVFLRSLRAGDLASAIRARARRSGSPGAAVSFPSPIRLEVAHIREAARHGVRTVILYGAAADCVEAFLRREQTSGRGLDQEFWIRNNAEAYIWYSRKEFEPYRIRSFSGGNPRQRSELLGEVKLAVAG